MTLQRLLALLLVGFSTCLEAQNNTTSLLNDDLELFAMEGEETDWENQLEDLQYLTEHPINLNTATKEQLEQFPFLSDFQIENLLAYIYLYGEMGTIYELQLVDEMDKRTIDLLLPYVCVEPVEEKEVFPSLRNILKYGKHEVQTRLDVPFYQRKAYKENIYSGSPLYHSLRYQFRYSDYVQAGILGEKDAGEPFFSGHNRQGYDHYSFYFVLNKLGRIKTLALGNYRLSFGQGLILNSNFRLGKTFSLTSSQYRASGIRKHSSADEYNYSRGVASTVQLLPHLDLSLFYSNRKLDGTIENGKVTSINETGLHRTQREANRKWNFTMEMSGGNLTYEQNSWKVGVTGIYYRLDKDYLPTLAKYAKYNIQGNDFYNLSIDYRVRHRKWELIGEEAAGKQGVATLNRLIYNLRPSYNFMLLHRYYSHDYWSLFGNSFGESSRPQNENGWYLASEIAPIAYWRLFGAIDLFSHPWWKYRISKPSQGLDAMLQATYTPRSNLSFVFNYRYKRKERDVTGSGGETTLPTYHHRTRLRMNYETEKWIFRTTADFNQFQQLYYTPRYGYQFTQMIHYHAGKRRPLSLTFQGSYFHTDDYDTRVYAYERGLLNTFYSPSFSGEGFRLTAHARIDFSPRLMLLAKLGQTIYTDRNEIGSGNDLIQGNRKTDLQLQLRIKLP